jgi:hypothetical protein
MTGFDAPLPTDLLTAGRTVPVKFALTAPVALARVRLMADGALGGEPLAETSCHAQSEGRQHCNLKLPGTLSAGSVYAIVAQFIDADGNWATPTVIGGASSQNPLSFTSR